MDAIKINPGPTSEAPDPTELLRQFRASSPPPHLCEWTGQAEKYAAIGAINPQLLRHFIEDLQWFARHERLGFYRVTKRAFDVVVASTLMVALVPALILLGLAVKLTSPGPILYKQLRIGYMGKPFIIYKFRTMEVGAPRVISFINEQPPISLHSREMVRTTPVGRFLRRWGLDELPQLWNIVIGDMSFVGPRPLTPCDSAITPESYLIRFAVRPGLTGLWQAQLPVVTLGMEKLRLDAQYATTCSWSLDLLLLAKTLIAMVMRDRVPANSNDPDASA